MAKNIMFQGIGSTEGKEMGRAQVVQEEAYDYLAKLVKTNLDIDQIMAIVGLG